MDLQLKGKSVVITGGGTGIGKAMAMEFAREGALVSICGRREDRLLKTKQEAVEQGYDFHTYVVDVTDCKSLEAMADAVSAARGGIDIWVNNAGVAINRPVLDFTDEEYRYIVSINQDAVFYGSRIAGRHMIRQGRGGVILNASSYASIIPHSEGAVYAATKAAVSSMTKTFAANFAPYGIRVVGYIPGMIASEISTESIRENGAHYVSNIALQRLGVPEDLAKPMVFMASPAAGYITGVDIEISGGKYIVQNPTLPWEQAGRESGK